MAEYEKVNLWKKSAALLDAIAGATDKPKVAVLHRLLMREYRRLVRVGKLPKRKG